MPICGAPYTSRRGINKTVRIRSSSQLPCPLNISDNSATLPPRKLSPSLLSPLFFRARSLLLFHTAIILLPHYLFHSLTTDIHVHTFFIRLLSHCFNDQIKVIRLMKWSKWIIDIMFVFTNILKSYDLCRKKSDLNDYVFETSDWLVSNCSYLKTWWNQKL